MRALVYKGPETLEYGDFADPDPRDGEEVVEIASSGICGSDMHAFLGHDERRPPPLILGHEVAGTVRETGARVTVNPLVTAGISRYCKEGRDNLCPDRQIISMPPRHGGFADAVAVPPANVVELPEGFSTDKAALTEPIACGWHAVRLALEAQGAEGPALVIGGGAIGVGATLSLAAQGVETIRVAEPNATRRAYLEGTCGLETVDPGVIGPGEFRIVVDAVGIEPTRAQASALVSPGGVIVHIGLGSAAGGLDIRRMTLQEITFIGTYTYTAEDFRDTAQAMFDGTLGTLDWIETRPLSEGARAFADIRAGLVPAPKIILKP